MPREVSTTTKKRNMGLGPNIDVNSLPAVSLSVATAFVKPPFSASTAIITVTMPTSIMIPWMKSFIAVAIYPPKIT